MLSAATSSNSAVWSLELPPLPPFDPERGRMPSWQREILERKRAKAGGSPGRELSPGRKRNEHSTYRGFHPGKPRPRSPGRKPMKSSGEGSSGLEQESLVLQESLGPLHQNPFIRLEKERKRQLQELQASSGSPSVATSPIQHLLELYNVPGIKTIRAENIIIIESDPDYFEHSRSTSPRATDCATDPQDTLMAMRGSKVTEIRASEVVIYEPSLSQSQEELGILNHAQSMGQFSDSLDDGMCHTGRVSRLLEKFDQSYSRPQRSRSSDSLLDQDRSYKPHTVPKSPLSSPVLEWQSQDFMPKMSSRLDATSRFSFNGPTPWIPSKHSSISVSSASKPASPKRTPSSPLSPSGLLRPFSPSTPPEPRSPERPIPTEDKQGPLGVSSVREKFENYSLLVNQTQSKLKNFSQKPGNSTITVHPKRYNNIEVNGSVLESVPTKKDLPLTNGHTVQSELDLISAEASIIQEILAGNKKDSRTLISSTSEENRLVPLSISSSIDQLQKEAKVWRPKSEMDLIRSKFCAKPCESLELSHPLEQLATSTPSQQKQVSAATSSNDSFQIQPAPMPDFANISPDDVQAKALANIRMQSKNSFIFIPRKRQESSSLYQEERKESLEKPKDKDSASNFSRRQMQFTYLDGEHGGQDREVGSISEDTSLPRIDAVGTERMESTGGCAVPQPEVDWRQEPLPPFSSVIESHSFTDLGAELEYLSSMNNKDNKEGLGVPITNILNGELSKLDIPVTNIDDIVHTEDRGTKPSSPLSFRFQAEPSSVHFKGGNTFTVVPKRKPFAFESEGFRALGEECEAGDGVDSRLKVEFVEGSDAPHADLGVALKKRYPTVSEIEVIGGYMSLEKSCLSKHDSRRKKMKISFNENSLQTTFEYPSENSLAEEEDEGDEASVSETEEKERSYTFYLPRPSFINGTTPGTGLRQSPSNSGLSSYTPKHSVEFSHWQEHKYEERLSPVDSTHQESECPQKDMLTPADSSSLSDFSSEPALYF